MPAELVKMRTGAFISDVLDPFRQHLEKFWSAEQIDQVECDHKDMLLAYARKPSIKEILDAHDHKTFFNDAWDSVKTRFLTLRQFCGGLASMFPNTTSVESDFCMVKWEKDAYRTGLTSFIPGRSNAFQIIRHFKRTFLIISIICQFCHI